MGISFSLTAHTDNPNHCDIWLCAHLTDGGISTDVTFSAFGDKADGMVKGSLNITRPDLNTNWIFSVQLHKHKTIISAPIVVGLATPEITAGIKDNTMAFVMRALAPRVCASFFGEVA